MDEFLAIALAPPTVAFTALLALMLVYWGFVMIGALDLDLFDPAAAAEGADGGLAAVLSALRLRHAPVTVVSSFVALFGWLGCYFGMRHLAPILPLPGALSGVLVALTAAALALPATSLVTRPLRPLFRTQRARANADLIGEVVTVRTGRVDADFGQGTLEEGLLLHVRCEDPDALERGDRALIVAWDEEREVFEVEPLDALMGTRDEERRRA